MVGAVVPQRLGRLGSSYRPANERVQPAIACESNQPSHVRVRGARRVGAAAMQAHLLRLGLKWWHLSFGFVACLQGRLLLESCSGHGSMKVSCTLHFPLPRQRAQYMPNHPWNAHRCSQVLLPRLCGALTLGGMSADDASRTMPLDVGR